MIALPCFQIQLPGTQALHGVGRLVRGLLHVLFTLPSPGLIHSLLVPRHVLSIYSLVAVVSNKPYAIAVFASFKLTVIRVLFLSLKSTVNEIIVFSLSL